MHGGSMRRPTRSRPRMGPNAIEKIQRALAAKGLASSK